MITMRMKFEDGSVRRFQTALQAVKRTTQRGSWALINRIALFTAQSAHKAASLGKKRRTVITARTKTERRQMGGYKYAIRNYSASQAQWAGRRLGQGMDRGWWLTNDSVLMERLRDVKFRGAAKASWAGIIRKMGARQSLVSDVLKTVAIRTNWVRFSKVPGRLFIEFLNKLNYMAKIQPTILSDAILTAKRRLEGMERARIEKAQLAAWRNAA